MILLFRSHRWLCQPVLILVITERDLSQNIILWRSVRKITKVRSVHSLDSIDDDVVIEKLHSCETLSTEQNRRSGHSSNAVLEKQNFTTKMFGKYP